MTARQDEPRRGRIDRARILEAALSLADAEGLDALTMRRIAAELGVEAMALYRHAPNKDSVLAGLVETVLTAVTVQTDPRDGWVAELRRVGRRYRGAMLAHPAVFPLVATRPLEVPLARRPPAVLAFIESLLELFARAGFDEVAALSAYRAFTGFLTGHLLFELMEVVADPDEPELALRLGLQRLPARDFPRLRRAAPLLANIDHQRAFEQSLDRTLAGLCTDTLCTDTVTEARGRM